MREPGGGCGRRGRRRSRRRPTAAPATVAARAWARLGASAMRVTASASRRSRETARACARRALWVESTRASSRAAWRSSSACSWVSGAWPRGAQGDDGAVHLLAAGDRGGHERVDALALQVRVAQLRVGVAGDPERARREHGELQQRRRRRSAPRPPRRCAARCRGRSGARGRCRVRGRTATSTPRASSSSAIASATTGSGASEVRRARRRACRCGPASSSCSSNLTLLVSGRTTRSLRKPHLRTPRAAARRGRTGLSWLHGRAPDGSRAAARTPPRAAARAP